MLNDSRKASALFFVDFDIAFLMGRSYWQPPSGLNGKSRDLMQGQINRESFIDFAVPEKSLFVKDLSRPRPFARKIGNETKTKSVADWWLNHPMRRQYLGGVIFDPTGNAPPEFWNLWTGFPIHLGHWTACHLASLWPPCMSKNDQKARSQLVKLSSCERMT
jgi:hypothetical protein